MIGKYMMVGRQVCMYVLPEPSNCPNFGDAVPKCVDFQVICVSVRVILNLRNLNEIKYF